MTATTDDLLALFLSVPTTTPSLPDLAAHSGQSPEWLADALEAALEAGLVESWDAQGEEVQFILTPYATGRAGVMLSEDGRSWVHRKRRSRVGPPPEEPDDTTREQWQRQWDESVAAKKVMDTIIFCVPDSRSPNPLDLMIAQEEVTRRQWDEDNYPPMRLFLGIGAQWDNRFSEHQGGHCPTCDGKRLGYDAYCLKCHRSGVDNLFPAVMARLRKQMPRSKSRLKGGR
jgi:hypothetical protein